MTDMIKRRFNRAEWLPYEAQDTDDAYLYDSGAKRSCCLGLELAARGVSKRRLGGKGMPGDLVTQLHVPTFLRSRRALRESQFAEKAASLNDSNSIDLEEREAAIIKLFATEGIEVEFYGDLFPDKKEEA